MCILLSVNFSLSSFSTYPVAVTYLWLYIAYNREIIDEDEDDVYLFIVVYRGRALVQFVSVIHTYIHTYIHTFTC